MKSDKEYSQAYRDRLMADPVRYAEYLERRRVRHANKAVKPTRSPEQRATRKAGRAQRSPGEVEGDRERDRLRHFTRRYGITRDERDAMWTAQGGLCALCASKTRLGGRQPDSACVDHCHETGRIRGILCFGCNTALGKLGDTTEALERALRYVQGK